MLRNVRRDHAEELLDPPALRLDLGRELLHARAPETEASEW